MSFTDHKITQFVHRIVDLPDQPNLPADELKARFDSSPEELRQAVNGICDDAATLSGKVDSILAETFDGVVEKSMLSEALAEELDAKATQTALAAEVDTLEAADSALGSRLSAAESTITTHTSQIAQKCQVYVGTYTGTGVSSRTINIGFTPKAVLIIAGGITLSNTAGSFGALAVTGRAAQRAGNLIVAQIVTNGFNVYYNENNDIFLNQSGSTYHYIALR